MRNAPSLAVIAGLLLSSCSAGTAHDDGTPAEAGRSANASGTGGAKETSQQSTRSGTGGTGGQNTSRSSAAGQSNRGGSGSSSSPGSTSSTVPTPAPPKLCSIALNCTSEIVNDPKTDCDLMIRDGEGAFAYDGRAGVEIRGRTSQNFPKKNYSLELRTIDGADNSTALLGLGKDSDFVLDGAWSDPTFFRNALTYDVFRAMAERNYAPKSRFCTLSLNGKEQGIYRFAETIKRDAERVAITPDDGTGKSFIVKQDDAGDLSLSLGKCDTWQFVYPSKSKVSAAQTAPVQAWLYDVSVAINGATKSTDPEAPFQLLDLERTVDWILVEELAKNLDAFVLSLYFVRDAGGLAWNLPWDIDLGYGQPIVTGIDGITNNESPTGWISDRSTFIKVLSRSAALRKRLAFRYRELRTLAFSETSLFAQLAYYEATLTPSALTANFQLWPLDDVDLKVVFGPYTAPPVASRDIAVSRMKDWIKARLAWLDANIDAYPNGG